jgi:hypothetical protein
MHGCSAAAKRKARQREREALGVAVLRPVAVDHYSLAELLVKRGHLAERVTGFVEFLVRLPWCEHPRSR